MPGIHPSDAPAPDVNAPFLSLARLLDRDREDHDNRHIRDYERHETFHEQQRRAHDERHERDHEVAIETAKRMEREVEKTALRIEGAVQTALAAVAQTAAIHQTSHDKEHSAHTAIHQVEAKQVQRAEETQQQAAHVLSTNLEAYKHEANEWRSQLREQEAKFLRKEEFAVIFESMQSAIRQNNEALIGLRETVITRFSAQTGKTEGISDIGKVVVGAAGLILTLLTIGSLIFAFTR